jgi:hypothetical protein
MMHMTYDVNVSWTRFGASVVQGDGWRRTNNGDYKNDPKIKLFEGLVPCYPLPSLLMAADLQNVDFLTLDLEGLELQALKTMDWKKHDIKARHLYNGNARLNT